ncbi:diguanylate cyclase [Colwellia sp. MEBiC06753]
MLSKYYPSFDNACIKINVAITSLLTTALNFALFLGIIFLATSHHQLQAQPMWQTSIATPSLIEKLAPIKVLADSDQKAAIKQLNALKPDLINYPVVEQLEYYHLLAETYNLIGQYRLTQATAEQALILASSLISPSITIAKLSYDLGFALESLGNLNKALEQYFSGLEVAESLEDQKEVANGLINIGAIYYQSNRLSDAIVTINEAAVIAETLTDQELKGYVYSELGILYGNLGEAEQASEYYQTSYQQYMAAGKPLLAVNNLRNIAIGYWGQGEHEQAIEAYQRLLKELEPLNSVEMLFSGYIGLARVYAHESMKSYDLAFEYLAKTEQLLSKVEHHALRLEFLIDKAQILKEMGRYDQALQVIDEGLTLFHSKVIKAEPLNEAALLVQRSETYRLTGQYKKAYDTYQRVYDLNMESMENSKTEAVAELRLQYESRRADIERNLLENKNKLESNELAESQQSAESKQRYIYLAGVVALIFGFLLQQLIKSQRQLLTASRVDALTNALNRRRFTELAHRELAKAKRQKSSVALLLIDCDHFKAINDNYGHGLGDDALKIISDLGQRLFSKPMVFARFGGEEFIALIPQCDVMQAQELAERFRSAIAKQPWNSERKYQLSVSIGVTTTQKVQSYQFEKLFEQVDQLLYQAKKEGRNQVCV